MKITMAEIGSPCKHVGTQNWDCYVRLEYYEEPGHERNEEDLGEDTLPASSEEEAYALLGRVCHAAYNSKESEDLDPRIDKIIEDYKLKEKFPEMPWEGVAITQLPELA